jgi:hypothetical protein
MSDAILSAMGDDVKLRRTVPTVQADMGLDRHEFRNFKVCGIRIVIAPFNLAVGRYPSSAFRPVHWP